MEHTLDNLKISKEFSSYSSFYKTQVSLSPEREGTANGRTGLENNKADETDEKHRTRNESSVNITENANKGTVDQRQSDMNNNSSQAEKINNASALEKRDEIFEPENDMLPVNGKRSPDKPPPKIVSLLKSSDLNIPPEDNKGAGSKTQFEDNEKANNASSALFVAQVLKTEDKTAQQGDTQEQRSEKSLQSGNEITSKIQSPEPNSKLQTSPEDNAILSVNSSKLIQSDQKLQHEDKATLNITLLKQEIEPEVQTDDKLLKVNSSGPGFDRAFQPQNKTTPKPFESLEDKAITDHNSFESLEDKAITDHDSIKQNTEQKLHPEEKTSSNIIQAKPRSEQITPEEDMTNQISVSSIQGHERKPSSRLKNESKGDDREEINLTSMQDVGTEQRLHSKYPSDHAMKTPMQDTGNNPVIDDIPCTNNDGKNSKMREERPITIEKDSFAQQPAEENTDDQLPETEHQKVSGDETDIDKEKETFQEANLLQDESKNLHLNGIKNDRVKNATIHLENEDKKDLKGEIDKQPVSKDNSLILTLQEHKANFETEEEETETLEKQPQIVKDDNAGLDIRPNTTYDNLYFTGRLPSLLSKNGSSPSFSTSVDHSGERVKAIAEDEEVSNLKKKR